MHFYASYNIIVRYFIHMKQIVKFNIVFTIVNCRKIPGYHLNYPIVNKVTKCTTTK